MEELDRADNCSVFRLAPDQASRLTLKYIDSIRSDTAAILSFVVMPSPVPDAEHQFVAQRARPSGRAIETNRCYGSESGFNATKLH